MSAGVALGNNGRPAHRIAASTYTLMTSVRRDEAGAVARRDLSDAARALGR
jgi:hypothetical protein